MDYIGNKQISVEDIRVETFFILGPQKVEELHVPGHDVGPPGHVDPVLAGSWDIY